MNRLAKIEEFCHQVGIFASKQINGEIRQVFGPYGNLLLNQIKSEWLKINLRKYPNNYLVKSTNLLASNANSEFDVAYFGDSAQSMFGLGHLPLGIVNTFEQENDSHLENSFTLFKHISRVTHLKYFYINDSPANDCLAYWQTERKRWWTRHCQNPQNITLDNLSSNENANKSKTETEIRYSLTSFKDMQPLIQHKTLSPQNTLEKITYFSDIEQTQNQIFIDLYRKFSTSLSSHTNNKKKDFLMTQTTCEQILENILLDSLNIPSQKTIDDMQKFNLTKSKSLIFELDYRLAPYKACILYGSDSNSSSNENLTELAVDLKKLCYLNNINVFVMTVSDENELKTAQARLDLMGVPFCIYLPPTIVRDGVCLVRNRDTSLSEETHYSNIAKNFKSFGDSLNFS